MARDILHLEQLAGLQGVNILQLESQSHNAVVQCVHFVCVPMCSQWNIVKHTNTCVHYHCLVAV